MLRLELRGLLQKNGPAIIEADRENVARVLSMPLGLDEFMTLGKTVKQVGVTDRFRDVIKTFSPPAGETPAGFRRELTIDSDATLRADLVRDISYDRNGEKRPTNLLFSADSANPYEVKPIRNLIANLTCNPGIIYDLFINNPKANVGGRYKTRDEVMEEIGKILGPGCDISVELNNPFEKSVDVILEEAAKFRAMFSQYRVVIKVPHTGPVNAENVSSLLTGDKRFPKRFTDVTTGDALLGHNLAYMLWEHGYRVNFTLMFEPYQAQLALQARPYFINSFVRHRAVQSKAFQTYLAAYDRDGDAAHIQKLRDYMLSVDFLSPAQAAMDSLDVLRLAKDVIRYRRFEDAEGADGLDGVRHNLRVLRGCAMADTRLIVCSMEGEYNYPDLDKLLASDEFADMADRVVITAEPNYLARFTSTNQVVSYQRRFMNAANGMK